VLWHEPTQQRVWQRAVPQQAEAEQQWRAAVSTLMRSEVLEWTRTRGGGEATRPQQAVACGSRQCMPVTKHDEWARLEFKIQTKFKSALNLIRSKHYHPRLQKIEIKYHAMWFDVRNKLCYWSSLEFE
jgi:hypothetical protein